MMKDLKTIQEQIDILESRGLNTDNNTAVILLKENYYALINRYKDPFLDKDKMINQPDVYKGGFSFKNLYSLCKFDKELRNNTFKYLLQAEAQLKTAVVYSFCNVHRQCYDYRDASSYTNPENMLVAKAYRGDVHTLYENKINYLFHIIDEKLESNRINKDYVKHYLKKYNEVPLWVLVNDLSFGNIESMYQLLKRSDQNAICNIIRKTSNNNKHFKITPHRILRAFHVLVWARNICAHDDRFYCAKRTNDNFGTIFLCLK